MADSSLRCQRPIIDPYIINHPGPEASRIKPAAGTNTQTTIRTIKPGYCVTGYLNIILSYAKTRTCLTQRTYVNSQHTD